jgi:hypothetical protein
MSPEPENRTLRETISENRLALIFGVIAIAALVVACVVAVVLLRPPGDDEGDGPQADTTTPTPFPTVPGVPDIVIGDDALVVGISGSSTISVSLDVPVVLSFGGERFQVRTDFVPASGTWEPTFDEGGTAIWVYGTVVNYVIGLPDSTANRELMGNLVPGEELALTTRGGTDYTFKFSSRDMVAASRGDVFAQNVPGLTVILLDADSEERMVVTGRYVVPEASSGGQRPVVELGETAQLEDLQITVAGATFILDRPEAPPGFAFYMVDYQIQNVGLTALDSSNLRLLLLDELGNQYALSPVASRLGNHPPLAGFLNSNQLAEATAGYQLPIGLGSPALNWVISRDDIGGQVQVTIPFSGGRGTAQGTAIDLLRAEVSSDLTSLILGGQVTNLGDQQVLVAEGDVTLRISDGSVYLLLSTNPPFPWTISPQQSLQFLVTFQRPLTANSAVFTVLNQPYELTGLR